MENINSVLVFAKGTIDKPIITNIIRIYSYNELGIDKIRRYIYDCERRGVQPKTGDIFDRYNTADFAVRPQISASSSGYSSGDGLYRSGSNSKNNGTDKQRINYIDTEYLELAKNSEKNEAKLQKMADEAAKEAGAQLNSEGTPEVNWHGTDISFNSFDIKKSKFGKSGYGIYVTTDKNKATEYGGEAVMKNYIMSNRFA
ncbi:MAG: hypothetical protein E7583_00840 [Ruminococcaceae bacterium]|nr:hypothetical protein [Oscillospiraceae bacterium]